MTSDVMHSINYGHLEQILFFHLHSIRITIKAAGSSRMPLFTPTGYTSSHCDTPSFVSGDSILTCNNATEQKVADEYRSFAIIRGFEIGVFFFPFLSIQQNGSCFNIRIYFLPSFHLPSPTSAKTPHFIK